MASATRTTSLLKASGLRASLRTNQRATTSVIGGISYTATRGKATLPDLSCKPPQTQPSQAIHLARHQYSSSNRDHPDTPSSNSTQEQTTTQSREKKTNLKPISPQMTTAPSNPKFPVKSWSSTTPSTIRPTSTATTPPSRSYPRPRPRATCRLPPRRHRLSTSTAAVTSTTPSSGRISRQMERAVVVNPPGS